MLSALSLIDEMVFKVLTEGFKLTVGLDVPSMCFVNPVLLAVVLCAYINCYFCWHRNPATASGMTTIILCV